ncbi:Hypothetical protein A7982_06835 [Minicystis rosea]|nr:Hypothetical protein A7982_06835 [Minicystis rosea]
MASDSRETKGEEESVSDRIQKQVLLRAPRSRVWRALSRAEEFGTWFGARLTGEMVPGATIRGAITYPGYEHLTLEILVEQVEPERLLSFLWHPHAVDPAVDYSPEPRTRVTFELADAAEGILLTVTESGFDRIPEARRALAFRMNSGGWEAQMKNIARHLAEAGA